MKDLWNIYRTMRKMQLPLTATSVCCPMEQHQSEKQMEYEPMGLEIRI